MVSLVGAGGPVDQGQGLRPGEAGEAGPGAKEERPKGQREATGVLGAALPPSSHACFLSSWGHRQADLQVAACLSPAHWFILEASFPLSLLVSKLSLWGREE